MNLKQDILDLVRLNSGIKAREIANQLGIDKSQVNSMLYSQLRGQVYQDKAYQWHYGQQQEVKSTTEVELNTPLARLSRYYLDCLGRDIDVEVSVWASNKYGCPNYGQLPGLPGYDEDQRLFDQECVRKIIRKVAQEKYQMNLVLGYPLYLNQFQSRKGTFRKIEPLFLFKFDQDSVSSGSNPLLSEELPQINPAAFKNLSGAAGFETLNEILALYEELGLNENEVMPDWDDLFHRLQAIREEWPWKEDIRPDRLSDTLMEKVNEPGIFNTAAIFASERSRYTVGLESELNEFIQKDELNYQHTALGEWISKNPKSNGSHNFHLIEPTPLNEEQRQAVEKSLSEPLTVVTGPPGTGKSQVVTNILVNAVYNNQKVLFASKNNKAVDVVNERVNALSTRPILLRLGSGETRAELGAYLTSLLSATVSQTDRNRFEELKERDQKLQQELDTLEARQKAVIEYRNRTDRLEQEVEDHRHYFNEEIFNGILGWTNDQLNDYRKHILEVDQAINRADKKKQTFWTRLFWLFIKNNRFAELKERFMKLRGLCEALGRTFKAYNYKTLHNEAELINKHREHLAALKEDFHKGEQIQEYARELDKLKSSPDLFELSNQAKKLREEIQDNSLELWDYWSKLLPERITREERSILGDYTSLLKMIAKADEGGTKVEKKVWARYYQLLPKVSGILSAWAVTSLSVRNKVPSEPGFFDLVVIDEASQCDIASAIPLLYRAKRAVIIGDPMQLRHITLLREKEDQQLLDRYDLMEDYLSWSYSTNSLFDLASSISGTENVINLKDHHRSHANIIGFSNEHFYNSSLRIATKYEHLNALPDEPALNWKHVSGKAEKHPHGGTVNQPEAHKVVQELQRIVANGYQGTIGVVAPFRQQANLIREYVNRDQDLSERLYLREFLADTVHKFQGDERDVMIFSPTYSQGIGKGSELFLKNSNNLFNVAITRARASLIVIGDQVACKNSNVDYLSKFANYVGSARVSGEVKRKVEDYGPQFPVQFDDPKVSDWEKYFYSKLYEAGIRTMPQYQVGQYRLDLAIIDGDRKLDIEIDGEHYHRNWDGELVWRDQLRNMRLIEQGWDVKRFWVYEIRDDLERCIGEVEKWMKDKD